MLSWDVADSCLKCVSTFFLKLQMKEKTRPVSGSLVPLVRSALSRTHTVSLAQMLTLVFVPSSHLKCRWCSSAAALLFDHPLRLFHTSQSAGRGRCSAALVVIFKKKRESFEVPERLKWCLTSEWSETLGVGSLRGANLTPHNLILSPLPPPPLLLRGGEEGG